MTKRVKTVVRHCWRNAENATINVVLSNGLQCRVDSDVTVESIQQRAWMAVTITCSDLISERFS